MLSLSTLLVAALIPAQTEGKLPKVEQDFNGPARVDCTGKTLAAPIAPGSVRRVILTHNHGIGIPRAPGKKPELDPDEMIARFFKSSAKARQRALGANEQTVAEFLVLTREGEVFRLQFLRDTPGGGDVTALLVYGKGLACRFDAAQGKDGK